MRRLANSLPFKAVVIAAFSVFLLQGITAWGLWEKEKQISQGSRLALQNPPNKLDRFFYKDWSDRVEKKRNEKLGPTPGYKIN